MAAFRRKVVVVGDGACGKTCLISVFTGGEFPTTLEPTIHDSYLANVELDGQLVGLALEDTSGVDAYDGLRPQIYPDSHVIIICYSIDSPDSLHAVGVKYLPEVMTYCPGVPIVFVACKKDLRDDRRGIDALRRRGESVVTLEQGQAVAEKIGAHSFYECSGLTSEGVNEVFEGAARAALVNTGTGERILNPFALRWKLGQPI